MQQFSNFLCNQCKEGHFVRWLLEIFILLWCQLINNFLFVLLLGVYCIYFPYLQFTLLYNATFSSTKYKFGTTTWPKQIPSQQTRPTRTHIWINLRENKNAMVSGEFVADLFTGNSQDTWVIRPRGAFMNVSIRNNIYYVILYCILHSVATTTTVSTKMRQKLVKRWL